MLKKTIWMIASLAMLASCGAPTSTSNPVSSVETPTTDPAESVSTPEESSTSPISTQQVTVNFYLDYNTYSESSRNIYATQTVTNGSKLEKPADPTEAPFEDFPTFLGWSTHPLIEDPDMLWDFEKDIVNTKNSGLTMYGIWDA